MYRGRLWTMRQFAGFGTAEDTNQRFRYLLAQGQTGLSIAFDLPTLMGYDSDHPLSEGEVGKCGVAISSLADMEVLFDQIPLGDVTTSMTINSPAAVIWAMYLAVAEKQGADWKKLSGTIQNDILKEYIAQKEYIYPPEPSMRLVIDTFRIRRRSTRRSSIPFPSAATTFAKPARPPFRNWLSPCATASNMSNGACAAASTWTSSFRSSPSSSTRTMISSRKSPSIAPRAASGTRPCANAIGAKNPRSWALRFHTQTAGCSLTAQQPYEQCRSHRDSGSGGGAGRHAIAAHEFARRSLGASHRIRRHHRSAHAADHRARNRRHQHGRSARRLLLCRDAHQ